MAFCLARYMLESVNKCQVYNHQVKFNFGTAAFLQEGVGLVLHGFKWVQNMHFR